MPENPHTEQELTRLTWVEQHITQLADEWRTHVTQLSRQDQLATGQLLTSHAGYAAKKVAGCIRDVDEMLAASRMPGPPLTAAFMAAQVIRWTRMLERLCDTVSALIDDGDTDEPELRSAPSVEDGSRRAAEAVRAVAASYAAAGQPQPDEQTEAAIRALVEYDAFDNRHRAATVPPSATATVVAEMWRAEAITKERQLREYDAMAEDLEALRDRLEDSPDADVCAAGVRLRAVLDDGGQGRLEAKTAAGTGGGAETWADVPAVTVAVPPGMVTVSVADLRAALEDWGYKGPVGPKGGLDGDLPVFRLTRAAYPRTAPAEASDWPWTPADKAEYDQIMSAASGHLDAALTAVRKRIARTGPEQAMADTALSLTLMGQDVVRGMLLAAIHRLTDSART